MTLDEFFHMAAPRAAMGFSGGADSAYLLYAAKQAGAQIGAYYVKTAFQPQFELRDAQEFCDRLGVELTVLALDILADAQVVRNTPERCYYCKRALFGALARRAAADGYPVLLDGTNASDDVSDRPGFRALQELAVRSPLRECGLTKAEIRRRSREAGLPTWNKPAYACLATRVQDAPLTAEKLKQVEQAEEIVAAHGFRDFRVRTSGDHALVQIAASQHEQAKKQWAALEKRLAPLFGRGVALDLTAREEEVY